MSIATTGLEFLDGVEQQERKHAEADVKTWTWLTKKVAHDEALTPAQQREFQRLLGVLGKTAADARDDVEAIRSTFGPPRLTCLLPTRDDVMSDFWRRDQDLLRRDHEAFYDDAGARQSPWSTERVNAERAKLKIERDEAMANLERLRAHAAAKGITVFEVPANLQPVHISGVSLRFMDLKPLPKQSTDQFNMLLARLQGILDQRDRQITG